MRNNVGSTAAEMYKATTSGWSLITSGTLNINGDVSAVNHTFRYYNSNNEAMFWVDTVSDIHTYNGTTVSTITHENLPTGVYPEHIVTWNNRLLVSYGDWVYVSRVGRPDDFDSTLGASAFKVGANIVGMVKAPGGKLMIFTKDTIQFLDDLTVTTDFAFSMEEFSGQSGAIEDSIQRMLGTVYFADDRGITTLEATDEFGDFSANSLAKKLEKSYQEIKSDITGSIVNRTDNQYILFYNVENSYAEGLVFSFKGKRLKGTTRIKFNHPVFCTAQGKDNNRDDNIFIGSSNGMVYKLFTGTSFDGDVINTYLSSSFYHYNSPSYWKHFKSILYEVSGEDAVEFTYVLNFDYKESKFPDSETEVHNSNNTFDRWGTGTWGVFIWDPISLSRIKQMVTGYGTNMQIRISTSERYTEPHSIHNAIVTYNKGTQRH
jgi:hypothetical protein